MRRKTILIFLISATIIGCIPNRIVKFYEFTDPEIKLENIDIEIGAKLSGEFTDTEKKGRYNVTVKGNPYELIISASSTKDIYKSVTVRSLILSSLGGETVNIKDVVKSSNFVFSEYRTEYEAFVLYSDLELPHEAYLLNIELEILTETNSILSRQIQMKLDPVYTEDKSNDTWSRINSV
jgi:hypothetical protein